MRALLAKDAKRFHMSIVYLMTYLTRSNGINKVQDDKLRLILRYIIEVMPLEYQLDAVKVLKYLTDREKKSGKNTYHESIVDVDEFKEGNYKSCIDKGDSSYHYSHDIHGERIAEELSFYLSEDDRLYVMFLLYRLAILDGIITTDSSDSEMNMLNHLCVGGLKIKPDDTIFTETTVYDFDVICDHLKQMAYLNKGVKIEVNDARVNPAKTETYCYEGGIKEYVESINFNKQPIMQDIIYCEGRGKYMVGDEEKGHIYCEVAMQYNESYNPTIFSFCNNIHTHEGGTHEEGFRLAMRRVMNDYARKAKLLKDDQSDLETSDILEGLTAIISVKHPNPQYEGQTKTKLGNSEVRKIVSQIVGEQLERFLLENPKVAEQIVAKLTMAAKARMAARAAQESVRRKTGLEVTTLPGKLADCSSKEPERCELYIVEGNSAGGSAKNGRDRETQAILPLRGKILNVEKATQEKAFENAEIGNMIVAIGAGIDPEFHIEKARYHKIVIMTDADVDGSHIRILLLTFFFRFMKELIEAGYVYIAQPPLYKVDYHGKSYYAYNDDQLENIKKQLALKPGYPFQRYKGLGEMDAEQLWETTMDPNNRKMLKVTMSDAIEADKVFTDLMGDEVLPRKDFIAKYAKFVKNLDI